jgi:hypothetical protein
MTIYKTLLEKGYFPKELPPLFTTQHFADVATSKSARSALESYKPPGNFTECGVYSLARVGHERRELGIPHPATFSKLARLVATNFQRLLKKAHRSPFSRSSPAYSTSAYRAISPRLTMGNLPRERASIRGGARFLVQTDISHFYPSLYTHAVGWAIDPAMRQRANWQNKRYLGKRLDQALMDIQAKESQGIQIGNDISFFLAEIVLAQIDRSIGIDADRAYRWFDDFEIACDSLEEAEATLSALKRELRKFRLRTNPAKTRIIELPKPADEYWRTALTELSARGLNSARDVVQYFDRAFQLAEDFPGSAVLNYAIGVLFTISLPQRDAGAVAESAMTQALLAEPGSAQKVFALVSFWIINGYAINSKLFRRTIDKLIQRHGEVGVTSDVSWALAFCAENQFPISKTSARILAACDDDCISLQALLLHQNGQIPHGFSTGRLEKEVANTDLDGPHWLLAYEAARHSLLSGSKALVKAHSYFSLLMKSNVTFIREQLPRYSILIHPGGAPNWLVRQWYDQITGRVPEQQDIAIVGGLVRDLVLADSTDLAKPPAAAEEFRLQLLSLKDQVMLHRGIEEDDLYT